MINLNRVSTVEKYFLKIILSKNKFLNSSILFSWNNFHTLHTFNEWILSIFSFFEFEHCKWVSRFRVLDFHINYCTDNRRFRAMKRKICSTNAERRSRETTRKMSLSFGECDCVQLRETTKRDRLKESPTPCTLSPASLELTRNYTITSAIRMPWLG